MHSDDNNPGGRVPLTGAGGVPWAAEPEPHTELRAGIRRARRASNWTAAALIAGTGAAALALAHHALPATAPATAGAAGTSGTAGTSGGAAGTSASSGPQVSHSVATTSGSGVTTTTTTRTVNGKTIITRTQHASAYSDN